MFSVLFFSVRVAGTQTHNGRGLCGVAGGGGGGGQPLPKLGLRYTGPQLSHSVTEATCIEDL